MSEHAKFICADCGDHHGTVPRVAQWRRGTCDLCQAKTLVASVFSFRIARPLIIQRDGEVRNTEAT